MAWQKKAKQLSEGKWLKWSENGQSYEVTFDDEPSEVEKTVSMGERKGEKYTVLSFPVTVDGKERLLEPNNSLLKQLLAEDDIEPIIGRTLMIKCLDAKSKKDWKVVGIQEQASLTRPVTQEETAKKDKFMKEVKEHKEKRTRKAKETPKETANDEEEEQGSPASDNQES